jgi:hypothetical protein
LKTTSAWEDYSCIYVTQTSTRRCDVLPNCLHWNAADCSYVCVSSD